MKFSHAENIERVHVHRKICKWYMYIKMLTNNLKNLECELRDIHVLGSPEKSYHVTDV